MKRIGRLPGWSRTARQFVMRVLLVLLCLVSLSAGMSGCEQLTDRLGLNQPADTADDDVDVDPDVATDTEPELDIEDDNVVEPIGRSRPFDQTDNDSLNQPDAPAQNEPFTAPRTPPPSETPATNPNLAQPNDQLILRNIIVSEDNRSQIAVPNDWQQEYTLHPTAELQAAAPLDQLYFAALSDTSFNSAVTTLDSRAARYLQQFIDSLSRTETARRTNVQQIAGYQAVQYQLEAELDGVPITFLHTTVATPFAYYQLLSWTLRSQFPAYREELQLVTQSFEIRN
ncbi:MAG: hypothetical protein ACTS2F_04035 [Thainema sp.]